MDWFLYDFHHERVIFLTAILLPQAQLSVTVGGVASLTQCKSMHFTLVRTKVNGNPPSEVRSQSPAEYLVGFDP